MNKITIIGNLTRAPESRTTQSGKNVCNFTVAVNRRSSAGQNDADYFRVQAWDKLGANCQQYLDKGKKVCVIGPVSVETYTANTGETRATMNVLAQDVEFLSPRMEQAETPYQNANNSYQPNNGYVEVEDDDLPF